MDIKKNYLKLFQNYSTGGGLENYSTLAATLFKNKIQWNAFNFILSDIIFNFWVKYVFGLLFFSNFCF